MASLVDMKDECDQKVRKFTRFLRKYNPAALPASALASNKNNWTNAVDEALEDLVKAMPLKNYAPSTVKLLVQ